MDTPLVWRLVRLPDDPKCKTGARQRIKPATRRGGYVRWTQSSIEDAYWLAAGRRP